MLKNWFVALLLAVAILALVWAMSGQFEPAPEPRPVARLTDYGDNGKRPWGIVTLPDSWPLGATLLLTTDGARREAQP